MEAGQFSYRSQSAGNFPAKLLVSHSVRFFWQGGTAGISLVRVGVRIAIVAGGFEPESGCGERGIRRGVLSNNPVARESLSVVR